MELVVRVSALTSLLLADEAAVEAEGILEPQSAHPTLTVVFRGMKQIERIFKLCVVDVGRRLMYSANDHVMCRRAWC